MLRPWPHHRGATAEALTSSDSAEPCALLASALSKESSSGLYLLGETAAHQPMGSCQPAEHEAQPQPRTACPLCRHFLSGKTGHAPRWMGHVGIITRSRTHPANVNSLSRSGLRDPRTRTYSKCLAQPSIQSPRSAFCGAITASPRSASDGSLGGASELGPKDMLPLASEVLVLTGWRAEDHLQCNCPGRQEKPQPC